MIEEDPSRYGKNEIPPMLLEQQPPNNPPQCQNTCFSSSCPPMVTQGHFFHLQHHLLYPFSTRFCQYTMTNLQKGKANTVPLERDKGFQHQDEHNPFVVGLNELLGHSRKMLPTSCIALRKPCPCLADILSKSDSRHNATKSRHAERIHMSST